MGIIGSALSVAKGQYGHIAAGALIGGAVGAAYGGMSRDGSALESGIRGAIYGGLAGGAIRAARAAHAGFHMDAASVSAMAKIDPRWAQVTGRWGTAGMAMRQAGKSEFNGLKSLGKSSSRFIGNSYSKAVGKIGSMQAAREGRMLAARAEAKGTQLAHVDAFKSFRTRQAPKRLREEFIKARALKNGGLRNRSGSVWYKKKLYR